MFRLPTLPRTLDAALRDLRSARASVRAEAIRDLVPHAERSREQVVRELEAALRDDEAEVRSAAAVALADLGGSEALPGLLVAVEDPVPHVRQMAIAALGEIGDARATERLRRALGDSRPEVRFQAIMAFPRVCARRSDAVEALVEATFDDDPHVCHIALRMAEELGPSKSEEDAAVVEGDLLKRARALVSHDSPGVRVAAAIILARADEPGGELVLAGVANGELEVLDREDEAAAIELCGELELEAARAGLERRAFGGALTLRRDRFAWHARVALAKMGHARAVRDILRDLGSRDRDKRTLAVAAAARARVTEARSTLLAMRRDGGVDPGILDEALAALGAGDPG